MVKGFNDDVICIDFDGVLHMYSDGWQDGEIYDEPVPGAVKAMHKWADKGYKLVVLTARDPSNHPKVKKWLMVNGFPPMEVTNVKIPAFMYIDDRAIRFTNWADVVNYAP